MKALFTLGYLLITLWSSTAWSTDTDAALGSVQVQVTEIDLYDQKRQRPVKITVWYPSQPHCKDAIICLAPQTVLSKAVVFSHGAMGAAKGYSWIGKMFAAQGYVTVGINHYGESWIYGPEHVNPAAVLQFWERPIDISFVLDQLSTNPLAPLPAKQQSSSVPEHKKSAPIFNRTLSWDHIIAVGHSSGAATILSMAGSKLAFDQAATYCATAAAEEDRSCHYLKFQTEANTKGYNPNQDFFDARIRSIIALDPALGHATTRQSLSAMHVPVLVIGSQQNDFLPFARHAGFYANTIPNAQHLVLDQGEGHFIYLDPCNHAYQAMGVSLCTDRTGVDRRTVHQKIGPVMLTFLSAQHS